MDTLPGSSPAQSVPQQGVNQPVGSMAKEVLPKSSVEIPLSPEAAHESELPPEIEHAGVRMISDSVELPAAIRSVGVTQTPSPSAAPQQAVTVALPLTDDQIAAGLHKSILSSWRWLAEWCTRQLKYAHILLQSVGGRTERVSS